MSSRTLAIHLSARRLCVAVAQTTIGSLEVLSLEDAEASQAGEVLERLSADSWDRVLATCPADLAMFRFLEFPFHDRRRLDQAVAPALEEHVPMSLDEAATAYDFTGPDRGSPVLAAMAARDRLSEHAASLEALGVGPQRTLWAPCVTLEPYRKVANDGDRYAIVDVSVDGAVVAVIDGERLIDLRLVGPCNDDLLVRNVVWSLKAMAPPGPRLILGGPGAAAVAGPLAETLSGFAIEPLPEHCPLPGLEHSQWRSCAPAVGLLYAAAGELSYPVLDFSPRGSDLLGALGAVAEELRPLGRWAAAAALLALIAAGADYARLSSQHGALEDRATAAFSSAMPTASLGPGKRLKLEMRLRELSGRDDATGSMAADSPLRVLAVMSKAVARNLDVEFSEFDHAPPKVRVAGRAASFESVTRLEEALRDSGHFAAVEVKDVHAAVGGEGVEFDIVLRLDGTGGRA